MTVVLVLVAGAATACTGSTPTASRAPSHYRARADATTTIVLSTTTTTLPPPTTTTTLPPPPPTTTTTYNGQAALGQAMFGQDIPFLEEQIQGLQQDLSQATSDLQQAESTLSSDISFCNGQPTSTSCTNNLESDQAAVSNASQTVENDESQLQGDEQELARDQQLVNG